MFKDLPNHYLSDNDIEKHAPAPWDIPTLQPDKTEISVSGPKTPKVALIPSRDVSYNEQTYRIGLPSVLNNA